MDTNKGRQELLDELNMCRDTIRSLTEELNEARLIIHNALLILNSRQTIGENVVEEIIAIRKRAGRL